MVRAGREGGKYSRENTSIIRVLRRPGMVSVENKRRGGAVGQNGLCPLLARGSGPAEPRGGREGGQKGQRAERTAGAAERDVEKGIYVPHKSRGSRMGSSSSSARLLRAARLGNSRGTRDSRDSRSPCPGSPRRSSSSSISEAGPAPLLLART